MFCNISAKDVLRKISLGYIKKLPVEKENWHPIEEVAQRFNQVYHSVSFTFFFFFFFFFLFEKVSQFFI